MKNMNSMALFYVFLQIILLMTPLNGCTLRESKQKIAVKNLLIQVKLLIILKINLLTLLKISYYHT